MRRLREIFILVGLAIWIMVGIAVLYKYVILEKYHVPDTGIVFVRNTITGNVWRCIGFKCQLIKPRPTGPLTKKIEEIIEKYK